MRSPLLLARARDGMIYVWSPGMPLSVSGLKNAKAAATERGISFTAVVDDARPGELEATGVDTVYQRTLNSLELVYRNATIHYPTAIFYHDGKLLGSAIPGYKTTSAYRDLARDAFAHLEIRSSSAAPTAVPAFWVDHKASVTETRRVETVRPVGFFFKPVVTTDLISYTSRNAAFIFDLGTKRELRIPGTVDPVPTPDGKFMTRRVVTGWRTGLRLRDYDVTFTRDGKPQHIEPIAKPMVPCPERVLVLPISSKGTREVGVFDKTSNTNRVIEVSDDCNAPRFHSDGACFRH